MVSRKVSDFSLFTKSENEIFVALLVYVDNIIVTRNNVDDIASFKSFQELSLRLKTWVKLTIFLELK